MVLLLRVKQLGNEADHWPLSSAEVKNEKICTAVLQNRGSICCQPVHYSALHGRCVICSSLLPRFSARGMQGMVVVVCSLAYFCHPLQPDILRHVFVNSPTLVLVFVNVC